MRITVVGDTLLDVDLQGTAEKLSPDAPVPVLAVDGRVERAGGAALVATLLVRDGAEVTLVTALSTDAAGRRLGRLLTRVADAGPGSLRVLSAPGPAETPVKTRVRAGDHVVARLDEGCALLATFVADDEMLAAVSDADAVVVADYGRGVAQCPELRTALAGAAAGLPIVWDPHPRGAEPVPGVRLVTPNLGEARGASGLPIEGVRDAGDAALALRGRWHAEAVVITLGAQGALLAERGDGGAAALPHLVPAHPAPGVDACGAGDRFAAALATSLAAGTPTAAAVQAAVASAGRFLRDGGVAALERDASPASLGGHDDALALARTTRARGGVVVATGGCFDLLHAGHARTLRAARALGDCLIVCLNSDESVRRLKGSERPIMAEDDRRDLLLALECVDAVAVFTEDTPEAVLRRLCPDVWVKGGDYVVADLPEAAALAEWGGRAVTVPYHHGRSTTALAGALARVG